MAAHGAVELPDRKEKFAGRAKRYIGRTLYRYSNEA
jgi:hypothetical protein